MTKATRSAEGRRTKQFGRMGATNISARITARIVVDDDGERHREYEVNGHSFGSIEAVEVALGGGL